MYEKIITHNDFDGLASAAICSEIYQIDNIQFAGPNTITNSQMTITEKDIVCDLPYPLLCGLWFDHHEGNFEELKYRKIDPTAILGSFEALPSCAHVCFNYANKIKPLPAHFAELVREADIIDAFNYQNIEDWRQETPGKIIEGAIKARGNIELREKWDLMRDWVLLLRARPLAEVARIDSIVQQYQQYQQEEDESLRLIEANSSFLPVDKNKEIVILDFTEFKRRPQVIKNLAYLLFPAAEAVIELNALFNRGIKTTNFGLSMSLSLILNNKSHKRDVGVIMRELNLGDGHAGAAGGTAYCDSKQEMLQTKKQILQEIYEIWRRQV